MAKNTMQTDIEKIKQLEERLNWLETVIKAFGLPTGRWMPPADAAKIIGCQRDKLVAEIESAESIRLKGGNPDLVYGLHYMNIARVSSSRDYWVVNAIEFSKVFGGTPPEKRKRFNGS